MNAYRTGHGGLSRQHESKIIMTLECARTAARIHAICAIRTSIRLLRPCPLASAIDHVSGQMSTGLVAD